MAYTIGTGNRGIVIRQQTNYGTVGSGTQFFGLIDDESFNTLFDVNARADMTKYSAHTTKTGKRYGEGSISMALDDSVFCALMLKGIFPKVATTGSGDPYTHAMTEITHDQGRAGSDTFPIYECIILRDEKEHTYKSMQVNNITISASVGEYVMLSADFVGKAEDSSSPGALSAESGAFDPDSYISEPVHFQSAEVFFKNNGTKTSNVSSVELSFNLNRDVDASFALGSEECVREAPPQLREVTGSIEFIAPIHSTSVDEPVFGNIIDGGSSSVFNPGSSNPAMKLTFTSTTNHDIIIKLYKLQWEAPSMNVSGRDTQMMSLNFTALYDETAGKVGDCTIRNAASSL